MQPHHGALRACRRPLAAGHPVARPRPVSRSLVPSARPRSFRAVSASFRAALFSLLCRLRYGPLRAAPALFCTASFPRSPFRAVPAAPTSFRTACFLALPSPRSGPLCPTLNAACPVLPGPTFSRPLSRLPGRYPDKPTRAAHPAIFPGNLPVCLQNPYPVPRACLPRKTPAGPIRQGFRFFIYWCSLGYFLILGSSSP